MAVESRGFSLIAASWAEFSIATCLLILRTYTTFYLLRGEVNGFARAATGCAALAWTIGLLNSIFVQLSADNGMGRHLEDIPLTTLPSALLYSWTADAMSRLSIASGKVAVVLFLCALQQGVQKRWQRNLLRFVAISNILINIVVVFTLFFQCSPPRKLWQVDLPGECNLKEVNNNYGFFATAWGAASDLVLALYPTYLFWSLKMELRMKVTMCILFGLGIFAAACAAVTCYQLHVVTNSSDPTWIQTPLTQWGYTEMWVLIMAACVPPSIPWFKRVLPKMTAKITTKGSSTVQSKEDASAPPPAPYPYRVDERMNTHPKVKHSEQHELMSVRNVTSSGDTLGFAEAVSLELNDPNRRATAIAEHV